MELTPIIKSKALELGFDKIGISDPAKQLNYLDYYDDWTASGKNGTMEWLERRVDERKDVKKYFPEIKSVITVAINYFTGTSSEIIKDNKNEFKFSNYAWGVDYHLLIKEKLNLLLNSIKDETGQEVKGVICVDTSPIMEKQWARQAGIGWQGKNTLIINDELGSWLFLGELLIDLELEFDEPFVKDLCGNCTACIEACSVNALTEYGLDASKCISYQTVEYKQDFTEENYLNGWIYGCDTCQHVCPWNIKKETISKEENFQPISEIRNYSLDNWLDISELQFKTTFKNSPVKRIKHQRFLRNVKSVKESSNTVD